MAAKTPDLNGAICFESNRMCVHNLMGKPVPMDGRVPRAGGRRVKVEGKSGVIYEPSPEEEAFKRWQEGDFLQVERRFAKVWRAALNSTDLLAISAGMTAMGINPQTCHSLEDAKRIADLFVHIAGDRPLDRLKFARVVLGLPPQAEPYIAAQWEKAGFAPLVEYAPFAAHVLTIELFFQIALAANLMSTKDVNNRTDISYLYYLPFCMLFVSLDRLHERVAPLFLRPDQEFVWGQDLKNDLHDLVGHYSALPQTEKEKGVFAFARTPPIDHTGLVGQLWDRHLKPWRRPVPEGQIDPLNNAATIRALKELINRPTVPVPDDELEAEPEEVDMMTVQGRVRVRRGSFRIFSKELEEADKKAGGDSEQAP